jgi:hypothetical protein
MQGQGLTSGNDRRLDGGWLPVVGEVVCVHPPGPGLAQFRFLALIVDILYDEWSMRHRYRVQALFAPRTNEREYHSSVLEETIATFEGFVCFVCDEERTR